jgi:hypothetical protein
MTRKSAIAQLLPLSLPPRGLSRQQAEWLAQDRGLI